MRRWTLIGAVMAIGTVVLVACGGGGGDAGPATGGTLIDLAALEGGSPQHIDPALTIDLQGQRMADLLYDGLVEWDFTHPGNAQLEPAVAESYEANRTGDVFTFTIRDGVEFSNGDPVLPSSFAFAWDRADNPALRSPLASLFAPIEGAAAVQNGETRHISGVTADDRAMTLTVRLTEPFWNFPATLSATGFSPLPQHVVERLSDQRKWERGTVVGNGPFEIHGRWRRGAGVTMSRNDRYYGGIFHHLAYLDGISFVVSDGQAAAYEAFDSGHGQTASIPPHRFRAATRAHPHETETTLLATYSLWPNLEDPLLGGDDGLKLRQAIGHAIDRQRIDHEVFEGARTPATGVTPPAMPGYQRGLCDGRCDYDPVTARRLVREWLDDGHVLTHPIQLSYPIGTEDRPVIEIVRENLEAVGIDAELNPVPLSGYFDFLFGDSMQVGQATIVNSYPGYEDNMGNFDGANIGSVNLSRLDDPRIDALLDRARRTENENDRASLYRDVEARILEQGAVFPIHWINSGLVHDPTVCGLIVTPIDTVLYDQVSLEDHC